MIKKLISKLFGIKQCACPEDMDEHAELYLKTPEPDVPVYKPEHCPSHLRFRNVTDSPGGLAFTVFENSSGFSISSVTTNTYVFDCGSNATVTEKAGGLTVTAGPVTQLA